MTSQKRQALILEHLPYVRGVAFNICWSRNFLFSLFDDCMSIAAEAMIRAIDNYDGSVGASLKTWIFQKVRFAVLDFIRKENASNCGNFRIEDFINSLELSSDGTEQMICNRDLVHKFLSFIEQNKGQRTRKGEVEDLSAYLVDGYLMREIADWRGCTMQNVSLMISGLKKIIVEEFGEEFDFDRL